MSNDKKWPQIGDTYYILTDEGLHSGVYYWRNTSLDQARLAFGNCFPTQTHAIRRHEALKVVAELRAMPGVFVPGDSDIFYIIVNLKGHFYSSEWSIGEAIYFALAAVAFRTENDCIHAINTIGQERLALYRADFINLPIGVGNE